MMCSPRESPRLNENCVPSAWRLPKVRRDGGAGRVSPRRSGRCVDDDWLAGLDRNKRRLPLRIHLQDVPQYREIFFRQRHHHQQSAHLLGLKRFFDVGDGEILELYLLASEIVFLGECLDDSMVDLAAADANSLALEVAHALDGCTGRDDQYDGIGKEHNRTRVRRVFEIGANDREVHLPGGKFLRGCQRRARIDNLQANRRIGRSQSAGNGRQVPDGFAFNRPGRNGQCRRGREVAVAEQARAGSDQDDAPDQHSSQPHGQSCSDFVRAKHC